MDHDIAQSLEALDRSTDRFGELIAAVPAVIYEAETGVDARWRYVSPQIERLVGDRPEDWIADPNLYTRRIHPADRKAVFDTEDDEVAIARREKVTCVTEYRMLHADGHLVWVRDEATLVDASSDTPFWRGILVDITVERTARSELTDTYNRHRSDRLAPAVPADIRVDVFRVSCADCDSVRGSEAPHACPSCGSTNVQAESMDGLIRQLSAARSNVEDLLDGVHRHLEMLGISVHGDAGLNSGSRRILTPLRDELDETA